MEQQYQSDMPDIFDLVERAKWLINAATGAVEPEQDYAPTHYVNLLYPELRHHSGEWQDMADFLGCLAMMRVMTGSDHNLDIERGMIGSFISRIGEDGLVYQLPVREDTPWRAGGYTRGTMTDVHELAQVAAHWLTTMAILAQTTEDKSWAERAQRYADTVARIAIYKDDYAYIPLTDDTGLEFSWRRNVGWSTRQEPRSEVDGNEGTVVHFHGQLVQGLILWHRVSGDERSLETARKIVNFMVKPNMWLGRIQSWDDIKWIGHDAPYRTPAAHFQGHFAGILMGLRGITDFAAAASDRVLLDFARQGYEWARNFGFASLGWWGENICVREMIAIAIRLSEAGVGDYWDDVERYVVNELVESQLIDAERLKQARVDLGEPMSREEELLLHRAIGSAGSGFAGSGIQVPDPSMVQPGYHGIYQHGIYYAYEAAVRSEDGMVHVNLPLNRVSPWLDVHSHLPYEGKLVVRNKTAEKLSVRVPGWADKRAVECRVNGEAVPSFWGGQRLFFGNLEEGDEVVIEFPMAEWTETTTWRGYEDPVPLYYEMNWVPKYDLHFKGNTCVGIHFEPGDTVKNKGIRIPAYQRDHFKQKKAPMKRVSCYVPQMTVKW